MNESMIPIMIGLFCGVLIVSIFLVYIQKMYYKKINDRSIENIKVLLKEFDKMKAKLEKLEKK